jgi:hypothetical protein
MGGGKVKRNSTVVELWCLGVADAQRSAICVINAPDILSEIFAPLRHLGLGASFFRVNIAITKTKIV